MVVACEIYSQLRDICVFTDKKRWISYLKQLEYRFSFSFSLSISLRIAVFSRCRFLHTQFIDHSTIPIYMFPIEIWLNSTDSLDSKVAKMHG